MKERILRFKTVPRWAILLLDLIILTWSFTLSYFIAKQFNFHDIIRGHFFIYTAIYAAIALPVFFLMRIHTGLIRYSDTRRSEEHTSELQSRENLVCRLLLE